VDLSSVQVQAYARVSFQLHFVKLTVQQSGASVNVNNPLGGTHYSADYHNLCSESTASCWNQCVCLTSIRNLSRLAFEQDLVALAMTHRLFHSICRLLQGEHLPVGGLQHTVHEHLQGHLHP
jgi:hypothetical protein